MVLWLGAWASNTVGWMHLTSIKVCLLATTFPYGKDDSWYKREALLRKSAIIVNRSFSLPCNVNAPHTYQRLPFGSLQFQTALTRNHEYKRKAPFRKVTRFISISSRSPCNEDNSLFECVMVLLSARVSNTVGRMHLTPIYVCPLGNYQRVPFGSLQCHETTTEK